MQKFTVTDGEGINKYLPSDGGGGREIPTFETDRAIRPSVKLLRHVAASMSHAACRAFSRPSHSRTPGLLIINACKVHRRPFSAIANS